VFELSRRRDLLGAPPIVGSGHRPPAIIVYGPLANGERRRDGSRRAELPRPSRFWQVVDKHKISIFYTAPTRSRLDARGRGLLLPQDEPANRCASWHGGEPINPEAWLWYYDYVGDKRCRSRQPVCRPRPGGILITPIPGATRGWKPGSRRGRSIGVAAGHRRWRRQAPRRRSAKGNLCLAALGPADCESVYGDHKRFIETYFSTFKGLYSPVTEAPRRRRLLLITGRVDDVINVAGIASAPRDRERAGRPPQSRRGGRRRYPHEIKGQGSTPM